jgi:autophagy-related protein 9
MENFPLLNEEEGLKYKSMNNDDFYKIFYEYYLNKGFVATILTELCSVISLGFTVAFSVFLFEFVNWESIISCNNEDTCIALSHEFVRNPFYETPSMYTLLSCIYFLIFFTYWCMKFGQACKTIHYASMMQSVYENMKITDSELLGMSWTDVLYQFIIHHQDLFTPMISLNHNPEQDIEIIVRNIILRIMRKENYLIALINEHRLDLTIPSYLIPLSTQNVFFTQIMEWSLHHCLIDIMFDEEDRLSIEFIQHTDLLKNRFISLGLIQLIILPFLIIFHIVTFFMENAQQFHSSKSYLGPRTWTPLAKWQFREFNELPHIFEERLNKAYAATINYLASFHNPYLVIIAESICFISGSLVVTLIILSFISEGALLYIHWWEHNLLWYLGIFSACYASCRSLMPDKTKSSVSGKELLQTMGTMTHHFPPHWDGKEISRNVRNEVSELFQYKVAVFWKEVFGVFVTPFVLLISLPSCADDILEFVK